MFARLLSALTMPAPRPLSAGDAQVALAALLVRVARADGDYSPPEIAQIDRVLGASYGLTPFEAVRLRTDAETLETEAPDTVRFTRALKEAVALEDRTALIEALWSVALVDGTRDAHEDAAIRLISNLLGVNDRDSALARQRTEKPC